jgi:crotonobetainyl-CoA:carnitine CoA-transferase CaiB-like acyl-CoA transferase
MSHVLSGYTVLDFTQYIAGPTATRLMAEMGAQVIKLELAPHGDGGRHLPLIKNGASGYFVQQNRGKKSLCVDLKSAQGRAVVKELLSHVDVVVENFTPGAIGRMGFDYATVHSINPRIVMCSISTFGQTGELANRPGYDPIGGAYAGVLYMCGDPDGPPSMIGSSVGDVMTGIHALAAITSALLYRERSGVGQYVEATLLDSYFPCHETAVQAISLSNGEFKPKRTGPTNRTYVPTGVWKGQEHYLFIAVPTDAQWQLLAGVIGKPQWATDPDFATHAKRSENADLIIDTIQQWLDSHSTEEDALKVLESHRIPVAPILSVEEAMRHPHLRARRTVRRVTDRRVGDIDLPGFPLRFSQFPEELDLQTPYLGEHNREILSNYLGSTEDRIIRLEEQGVLEHEPISPALK